MNLLSKYQSDSRTAVVQMFRDLSGSILQSFEGSTGRHNDTEYFRMEHDGLTHLLMRLNIESGTIEVSIQGKIGMSYDEANKLETLGWTEYSQSYRKALDFEGLRKAVDSRLDLKTPWKLGMTEKYHRVTFDQTVSELNESFLQDLVKILERVGYVPRVSQSRRVF